MRKFNQTVTVFLFTILLTAVLSVDVKAQSNWEIGARFGDPNVALDLTVPLSASPRLHGAAYFSGRHGSDFGLAAYFDWMFSLEGGPTGLKFYPGVGPEFWFGDFNFGVAGDFGVEYSFDFPLTLAFDWRPGIFFTNDVGFDGGNVGIAARFRFGEGVRFKRE